MFKKFYKSAFDSIEPPKDLLNELLYRAENRAENERVVYESKTKKAKVIKLKSVYKYSACIAAALVAALLVTAIPLLKISDNDKLIGCKTKQTEENASAAAAVNKQEKDSLKEGITNKDGTENEKNSYTAAAKGKNAPQDMMVGKKNTDFQKEDVGASYEALQDDTAADKKIENEEESAAKQPVSNNKVAVFSTGGSSEGCDSENMEISDSYAAIQSEDGLRSSGEGFYGKELSAAEACNILGINIDDVSLPEGVSYPDRIFVPTDSEGKPSKEGCGIYFSGNEKSGGIYYETAENEDFSAPNGEYIRKNIKKDGYTLTVECFGFTQKEAENLFKSIQKER